MTPARLGPGAQNAGDRRHAVDLHRLEVVAQYYGRAVFEQELQTRALGQQGPALGTVSVEAGFGRLPFETALHPAGVRPDELAASHLAGGLRRQRQRLSE